MKRAISLFATLFLLTACANTTDNKVQLGAYGFDLSLTARAISILFLLLVLTIVILAVLLVQKKKSMVSNQKFASWLDSLSSTTDNDLADLQAYSRNVRWATLQTDDLETLRATIENDATITPAEKIKRATTLGRLFNQWQNPGSVRRNGQLAAQLMKDIRENGSGIFLSLFALAVFITLAIGISNSSFFSSLAQVDQARGLITFLVAISAVAVILLTAINIFWGTGAADFKERYGAAKDLVTIVTGILGTILGFYFGSFNNDRLLGLTVDFPGHYSSVTAAASFDVKATAKGGTTPYHYDVIILDAAGVLVSRPIDNKESDGTIQAKIPAPPNTTGQPQRHSVIVLIRDARGLQTRQSIDILVNPATSRSGAGTSPTGTAPTGTAPTGTTPTGTAPTGTAPTGTTPTGTAPTGTTPPGTAPTNTTQPQPGAKQ